MIRESKTLIIVPRSRDRRSWYSRVIAALGIIKCLRTFFSKSAQVSWPSDTPSSAVLSWSDMESSLARLCSGTPLVVAQESLC